MKPWQIILMIVALLVLGGSIAWQLSSSDEPEVGGDVLLVDIRSGEVFRANTSGRRAVVIPAKHPDTGERTIYPAERTESGDLRIKARYLPEVREFNGTIINIDDRGGFQSAGDIRSFN
ncbi:MAG: hypothetical protein AAF356_01490 [Planctomycetota bacterium]